MSRKNLTRVAVGLAVSAGALLLVAGPAMADDSTDGPEGAGGGSSDFSGHDPSAANDITPGGVPVFGVLDSAKSAPGKITPGGAGSGY